MFIINVCFNFLVINDDIFVVFLTCQGIFMLVSGYFRLPNDIPKPVWRYPMSYISFHFWALQVKCYYNLLVDDDLLPRWFNDKQ